MTSYATAGGSSFAMKYSGSDERVEVQIGTATPRRFVYDESGRLIGEYGTGASDVKAEHVWMMPDVAEGGYEPPALAGTATTLVHSDQTGAHPGREVAPLGFSRGRRRRLRVNRERS